MAAPYIGNQDYRGYLNYLGSQGDTTAKQLLQYVGNDAKFGSTVPLSTAYSTGLRAANANYFAQYGSANSPSPVTGQNLVGNYYTPPARAASYDVTGNFNASGGQAAASQNPLYDKYINQLITDQRLKQEAQTHNYEQTVGNLDETLKNTTEANTLAGTRTSEDVALAEGKLATQADEFQTDSGTQNNIDRIAQARAAAVGGTAGSGSSNAATASTEAAHGTSESRQVRGFEEQKAGQELVKARTFEDLAKSTELATTKTTKGKESAKFDLDNYIASLNNEVAGNKLKIEESRKQAIQAEQERIASQRFEAFLNTLSDPVRVATAAKYQGSF